MKLENQLTSLELSKRLKELGVTQNGYFTWKKEWYDPKPPFRETAVRWVVVEDNKLMSHAKREQDHMEWYSALTVSELGELLPIKIEMVPLAEEDEPEAEKEEYKLGIMKNSSGWSVSYFCRDDDNDYVDDVEEFGITLAYAMSKMLIYLIENDLLSAPSERG